MLLLRKKEEEEEEIDLECVYFECVFDHQFHKKKESTNLQ